MWLQHRRGFQKIHSPLKENIQSLLLKLCLFTLRLALWIYGQPEEADLVSIGVQGLILSVFQTKRLLFQCLHILTWLEFS